MSNRSQTAWPDLPYAATAAAPPETDLEAGFAARCRAIEPVFASPRLQAANWQALGQRHIDNLTKPLGSLGRLEETALRLFCIEALRNGEPPRKLSVDPGLLFTVAADHGVTTQGVSPHSPDVTRQMLLNFLNGGAGVNALCRNAALDFMAVDAGVLGADFPPHPALIRAKLAQGSADFSQGPAMSRHECLRALSLGLDLAGIAAARGYRCLAAGEMGIGNTTPSSALYCAWLGIKPEDSVGTGAGLDPGLLAHKAAVVRRALEVNAGARQSSDPVAVLAALGGLEIAVMSGIMLGAATLKLPLLIDGFIAGAAFIAAWNIAPALPDYCFFAHCSAEGAHRQALKLIGRQPLLDLGLRLGEGSGAALAMCIVRGAVHMFNDMASFEQAGVNSVL
ncbi:MAG: nicotinate-nucleotide--dimethylbenzimidazole phosphoribosyltransferase [Deltaproteobacteria bacterium]|jgi:nicotinate-nucleotide--dimethylbenzimidazole phosphoribosyltransferase|nr:nicotinate-nucleotide--dimethylbenzimidazole phosphoribosyltransferase [Deltaproteobacteria bacterium]